MSVSLSSNRTRIMGVLNVTPDSFYDGGRYSTLDSALRQAQKMVTAGVDVIDIGGESTRPGAQPVSVEEELNRVIPVIERITKEWAVPVSIDSRNPPVIQAAIASGAKFINDINALQSDGALEIAVDSQVPVCLMHMKGLPQTMQTMPTYDSVLDEVYTFLRLRVEQCEQAGVYKENIYLDPGFGFGKTLQHNLALLGQLAKFKQLGCKLLVGFSRKSMLGEILKVDVEDRLLGSLSCALLACIQGADMIRTHDVKATKQVLEVYEAVKPFWSAPEVHLNHQGSNAHA